MQSQQFFLQSFLMDEQESGFLSWNPFLGKMVSIAEMTRKDLENYINSVDKAVAGVERIDSNSERSSTVGQKLSNSITCHRYIIPERKSWLMLQISLLSDFI